MYLQVEDAAATLLLLRKARQQCQVRFAQLAGCRVCGTDAAQFEKTVELLRDFERQLEASNATDT